MCHDLLDSMQQCCLYEASACEVRTVVSCKISKCLGPIFCGYWLLNHIHYAKTTVALDYVCVSSIQV